MHYFSPDGNYGGSDGLLIVDTSSWTEEMFEVMDSEIDRLRVGLARHFSEGKHEFETSENEFTGEDEDICISCELSKENLGIKDE